MRARDIVYATYDVGCDAISFVGTLTDIRFLEVVNQYSVMSSINWTIPPAHHPCVTCHLSLLPRLSQTFFGELQRIVKVDVPATPRLNLKEPQTLFFAIVKQCNAVQRREGFWEYTTPLGGLEAVDIGLVQCAVGRILDRGKWVIVDRSGERAHADIEASELE